MAETHMLVFAPNFMKQIIHFLSCEAEWEREKRDKQDVILM